jgi:hypothetical protein
METAHPDVRHSVGLIQPIRDYSCPNDDAGDACRQKWTTPVVQGMADSCRWRLGQFMKPKH